MQAQTPVALVDVPATAAATDVAVVAPAPPRRWTWLWVSLFVLFFTVLIAFVIGYFVQRARRERRRDAFLAIRSTQAHVPDGDYLVRFGNTGLYMGLSPAAAASTGGTTTPVNRVVLVAEPDARPWRYAAPAGTASVAGGRSLSYVRADGSLLPLGTGAAVTLPAPLTVGTSSDALGFGDWFVSRGPTPGTASQPAVIHNTALTGCVMPSAVTAAAGVPLDVQSGCPSTARVWYLVPVS
ncbi:Tip-associated adhesin-like domain-containing protein [Pandoravirus kuranda]|uniref:Tip-associated adhesin-like domain-containing protein n=2 Tax=Pandoravirus TaxID=2060084 RepID=A0AA95EDV4_9VIRU|nr:hypothetical protein pneo_cds_170 [Pandoravirus neocaledonia]AVK75777.1 hypothetical protein pneo_cds_170 [Pandoravirus neocaledonia]WBR14327.1 Tip-associated adhesin-like domain-containing protein [Pandoravirus kuranda]